MSLDVSIDSNVRSKYKFYVNDTVEMRKAAEKSVYESVKAGKQAVIDNTKKKYTLHVRFMEENIEVQARGYSDGVEGSVDVWKASNPLDRFKMNPRADTTGDRRCPLSVSVEKGESDTLSRAFSWAHGGKRAGSGHLIFRREKGADRLPVYRLWGPDTTELIDEPEIIENISEVMQETYLKAFEKYVKAAGLAE